MWTIVCFFLSTVLPLCTRQRPTPHAPLSHALLLLLPPRPPSPLSPIPEQVFEMFLNGQSLGECYASVAEVANHWLDVLDSRGVDLDDEELMDLISQNRTISQTLEDYGAAKVRCCAVRCCAVRSPPAVGGGPRGWCGRHPGASEQPPRA